MKNLFLIMLLVMSFSFIASCSKTTINDEITDIKRIENINKQNEQYLIEKGEVEDPGTRGD